MHFTKKSKFELMRCGRYRAARFVTPFVDLSAPLPQYQPPEPPVHTMEIDGVRYRESANGESCNSCAFSDGPLCTLSDSGPARLAFGDDCFMREVIYIRAEA